MTRREHNMHDDYGTAVLAELRPFHRELRHAIPGIYRAFNEFHDASFADGELDVKTKELIALAIAVVERCDGCIASHAEGARRAGASKQEAAEAIGVAMLMSGGPGTIYGPRAYAAFSEFAAVVAG
jgi:AhpD family alkylhydroperoxidase